MARCSFEVRHQYAIGSGVCIGEETIKLLGDTSPAARLMIMVSMDKIGVS
jgi:hypothetical protein